MTYKTHSPNRFSQFKGMAGLYWLLVSLAPLSAAELTFLEERSFHADVSVNERGEISMLTTGDDPQLVFALDGDKSLAEDQFMLAFEYFCPDGVGELEIFYSRRPEQGWSQNRSMPGGRLPRAEAWQPFAVNLRAESRNQWSPGNRLLRLDFGRRPGLHLQLRNVRLRAPTAVELRSAAESAAILQAKREKSDKIDDYLERDNWSVQIQSISVNMERVIIRGRFDAVPREQVLLIEFEPHEEPWMTGAGTPVDMETHNVKETLGGTVFELSLARICAEGRDRLANRYAVAVRSDDGLRLLSRAAWATDVSGAAEREMPRLRPANKKGMGGAVYGEKKGVFEKDLLDLGITSATVNLPIGGLLAEGRNRVAYEHQGKTWFFNYNQVRNFDETIKRLTEMEIVVSGIILITNNSGLLVHPEYDTAGVYSIANLTSREAADTYRAVVAFLAERYSRPDKRYGWISHWIVFNEIDYGWVWTNMGEQPMAVYMDAYEKAMRLTWLESRRFNPTAEVFISLTHHWDYQPADPYRVYAPRALVDRLGLYSQSTGDYHWGLAYHPYPQSLLHPRTWLDNQPTASFDTPKITPKNIEVLDAYMHQEHLLYQGKVRTVLLSEQGFHTPDYSEQSFLDKAAAIAFTWAKIVPLESIETFHYHRWIDHPLEGGLKLGLRTLADSTNPYGLRKEPAFSVMAAMETDRADEVSAPLKPIIGIQSWDEVRIAPAQIRQD
jgi:hypothetical protein